MPTQVLNEQVHKAFIFSKTQCGAMRGQENIREIPKFVAQRQRLGGGHIQGSPSQPAFGKRKQERVAVHGRSSTDIYNDSMAGKSIY